MKITPQRNAIDADNMIGEHNPHSKLTNTDVIQIVLRVLAGETQRVVAAVFRVRQSTVSLIMSGKIWSHVTRHIPGFRDYDPDAAMPRGSAHCNSILNPDIVREIRRRADAGESKTAIADDVGVSDTTIRSIVRRDTWADVA